MSPAFQETLQGNELLINSQGMRLSARPSFLGFSPGHLVNRVEVLRHDHHQAQGYQGLLAFASGKVPFEV